MPVISVLSMKGGVGKTTVTLGLASAAWKQGLRALVIDLDPQANATMGLAIDHPPFTVNDVLADARPGIALDAILPSGWGQQVHAIASERSLEHRNTREGNYSEMRLKTALANVPRQYEVVLLDCPPSLGELTRNALCASDAALVVTEPGYFALHGAEQAVEAIDVIRVSTNPRLRTASILMNRARTNVADHRLRIAELQDAFGPLVSPIMIPERNAIPQSEGAGIPIHAWDSPAGRELSTLFDQLLEQLMYPHGRAVRPIHFPKIT